MHKILKIDARLTKIWVFLNVTKTIFAVVLYKFYARKQLLLSARLSHHSVKTVADRYILAA